MIDRCTGDDGHAMQVVSPAHGNGTPLGIERHLVLKENARVISFRYSLRIFQNLYPSGVLKNIRIFIVFQVHKDHRHKKHEIAQKN
jgi:hypothetical protein